MRIHGVTGVLVLVLFASTAQATIYKINHGNSQGNNHGPEVLDTNPVSASFSGGVLDRVYTEGSVEAEVTGSYLSTQVTMTRLPSSYGSNGQPWVSGRVTFDDVVFFSLADPTAVGTTSVRALADYSTSATNPDQFDAEFTGSVVWTGFSQATVNPLSTSVSAGTIASNLRTISLNQVYTVSFINSLEMGNSGFGPPSTGSAFALVDNFRFELADGFGWYSPTLVSSVAAPGPLLVLLLGLGWLVGGHFRRKRIAERA